MAAGNHRERSPRNRPAGKLPRVSGSGVSFVSRALPVLAGLAAAAGLSGCGTTERLPTYEPPLARTEFQTVRTTAYTHTESDHLQYGQHNALGGTLHAADVPSTAGYASAGPPSFPPGAVSSPENPRDDDVGGSEAGGFHPPTAAPSVPLGRAVSETPGYVAAAATAAPPAYGSAAADWSRWPAGTVFRLLSTGQLYRVDDYGWALSGRNTIDLYMPTRQMMNAWAVRREPIQVVQWGDRSESLRILRGREKYRHIRRMVLELEGDNRAAARLE
jgi:3D (Asp-Asp-Asp) domain-containing protein